MKYVLVDVDKAEYQGRNWKTLGDFGKRKYENLLVLKAKEPIKIGDKVQYKSWAVDIVTVEGKRYYYLNQDTKGLCSVIT